MSEIVVVFKLCPRLFERLYYKINEFIINVWHETKNFDSSYYQVDFEDFNIKKTKLFKTFCTNVCSRNFLARLLSSLW